MVTAPDSAGRSRRKSASGSGWGLLLVLSLLAAGCGPSYKLAPVSGRVTLDGDPVPNVLVTFEPLAVKAFNPNPGPNSSGVTDADGRYTLRTIDADKPGAVVARHRVLITPLYSYAEDGFGPSDETLLPHSSRDGSLLYEVPPEGTDLANWDLTSE
jgi:hypothetical protein